MKKQTKLLLLSAIMTLSNLFVLLPANAASLSSASLTLGDPRPSETTTYTFNASGFTTGTTVRCVQLQLNDQADGAGSVPSNILTTSSTLDSSTLITAGSWTVDNGANGTLGATWATGETPSSSGNIVWGGVDNADTEGTVYFGIFTSYTDASCTGGNEVDEVTVAYIHKDGELVQLDVSPTLGFICQSVGASQAVNGDTTTHASTGTGIDYSNDVTAAANGISAHDLQVTTNATDGYIVYISHTAQLTNQSSDTIDNHSGTNASPTSFPAAGTESWGYTTEDSTLTGGTADRFTNGGPYYAGFSTTPEEVISNTAPVPGSETTRVGHQVAISGSTEFGTYQTVIIYSVVATY